MHHWALMEEGRLKSAELMEEKEGEGFSIGEVRFGRLCGNQ